MPELGDKRVVLAREQVVEETETNRPIVWKACCFLASPLWIYGSIWSEYRQVHCPWLSSGGNQEQLCHVGWIALDALTRSIVETIKLRSIPPCRTSVGHSLG